MLTTEFNLEDAIAIWKEEGREEGRLEVRQRVLALLDSGLAPDEVIAILTRSNET